jgi:hypothetical protein
VEAITLTEEEMDDVHESMRLALGYETTEDLYAAMKEANKLMCECGNPSKETTFYDNGEGELCDKHHYICDDCDLIFQVG